MKKIFLIDQKYSKFNLFDYIMIITTDINYNKNQLNYDLCLLPRKALSFVGAWNCWYWFRFCLKLSAGYWRFFGVVSYTKNDGGKLYWVAVKSTLLSVSAAGRTYCKSCWFGLASSIGVASFCQELGWRRASSHFLDFWRGWESRQRAQRTY